jgi:hypothetical protein
LTHKKGLEMKKNTEKAILTAFAEMIDAGLPVKEFDPHENKDGTVSFDWIFERGLTKAEMKQAKTISTKYIDAVYSVWK